MLYIFDMSTSTNSDDTRFFNFVMILLTLSLFVVGGLKWYNKKHYNVETFNALIYRISTTGAISGSQWRVSGFGGGSVSSEAEYFAKDFESLPDGSIRFTTLEGALVRCITYKVSKFKATFKRKPEYNQVFFIHPGSGHWVQVINPHLLDQ